MTHDDARQKRETLATVLAALRLFQRTYEGKDGEQIRRDWPEHFHEEDLLPLGTEDIDELCDSLNAGEPL